MDAVLIHVQQHLVLYIMLTVGVFAIIYATRRYSVPIIQYTLEVIIYLGIMHIIVWAITSGAAAFKRASSFEALETQRQLAATWTTPLLRFWELEIYEPSWIFKLEVVAAAIIVIMVWRLRPIKIQKSTRATVPPARRNAGVAGARTLGRAGGRRK